MYPYGWLALVYAAVIWLVLRLFGPQDRKQMKVRKDWKPVSEMYKGRR